LNTSKLVLNTAFESIALDNETTPEFFCMLQCVLQLAAINARLSFGGLSNA
jgi:hypothetical protein